MRKSKLGGIFVSYRRNDSQGESGRLFDDLINHFGEHTVFMDVSAIEPGRDFRKAIEDGVTKCGVLLVVMGPEWINAHDESGARRLDDPADFVRIETAAALRRDIPVIPVLVRGAHMPAPEQLPSDLKELAFRNCIELTHARWRSDVQLLIDALRRIVGDLDSKPGTRTSTGRKPEPPRPNQTVSPPIDNAVLQRVSRELAIYIGPISDIVVKRAAAHSASLDDLYLEVAREIDSADDRDRFLKKPVTAFTSTAPTFAATASARAPAVVSPPPLPKPIEERVEPAPPTPQNRPSAAKYLLVAGGIGVLIVLVTLAIWYSRKQSGSASQTQQPPAQTAPSAESAPAKTAPPPPEVAPAKAELPNPQPVAATEQTPPKPSQRVRVPQEVFQNLLITKVLPVYPQLARQARIKGAVILDVDISKNGTVESVRTVSGHPLLIPAAIDAVKQWRFKPYLLNGQAVPATTEITVLFTLSDG